MVERSPAKQSFPPLRTVCKNRFPFAIGCPSFVYPAGYLENVRRLAAFVDDIQLLFFESTPASLPSSALIHELAEVAAHEKIGYTIHLPTDVYAGHPDPDERRRAVAAIRTIIERCRALSPSTFTLHLEPNPDGSPALPIERWQQNLLESTARMLPPEMNSRTVAVENLAYPMEWVAPVIETADLSVCMDMGHLMAHGLDVKAFYDRWHARITTVHVHGVDGSRDHLGLNRLADGSVGTMLQILQAFSGAVVVENYSPSRLEASLAVLVDRWPESLSEGA